MVNNTDPHTKVWSFPSTFKICSYNSLGRRLPVESYRRCPYGWALSLTFKSSGDVEVIRARCQTTPWQSTLRTKPYPKTELRHHHICCSWWYCHGSLLLASFLLRPCHIKSLHSWFRLLIIMIYPSLEWMNRRISSLHLNKNSKQKQQNFQYHQCIFYPDFSTELSLCTGWNVNFSG